MFPNRFHLTLYSLLTIFLLVCAATFAYLGFFNTRPTSTNIIYEYDLGKEACYILGPNQQEKYVSCSTVKLTDN